MLLADGVQAAHAGPNESARPVRVPPELVDAAGVVDGLVGGGGSQLDEAVRPAQLAGPEQGGHVEALDGPDASDRRGAEQALPERFGPYPAGGNDPQARDDDTPAPDCSGAIGGARDSQHQIFEATSS